MLPGDGGPLCDSFREKCLVAIGWRRLSAQARKGMYGSVITGALSRIGEGAWTGNLAARDANLI